MNKSTEKELASHFSFGENWKQFSQIVTEEHVQFAQLDLERLLGVSSLDDKTFCDIGCGSGIHAVAAARMGAHVTALDIDPVSTRTTTDLAKKFGMRQSISVHNNSIFHHSLTDERFDIVYSWGVLHHTGSMWEAIAEAVKLVSERPGSMFAIALYRRTRLCRFWTIEKRFYKNAHPIIQTGIRRVVSVLMGINLLLKFRGPFISRKQYQRNRGMSPGHDLHDWLGGYPYESVTHTEILEFLGARGFVLKTELGNRQYSRRMSLGVFGSGCDEYVFVRQV